MLENIHDILHFWFGDDESQLSEKRKMWWEKSEATDAAIKERFESVLANAELGALEPWLSQAKGTLAYIILTDQFPRNMYRNTPQAFAYDEIALAATRHALDHEFEKDLSPTENAFLYMPLMHSEDLLCQKQCVGLFARLVELAEQSGQGNVEQLKLSHQFAIAHYDVIAQFGRFPHRNAILGRESRDEEIAFLKTPNSSF